MQALWALSGGPFFWSLEDGWSSHRANWRLNVPRSSSQQAHKKLADSIGPLRTLSWDKSEVCPRLVPTGAQKHSQLFTEIISLKCTFYQLLFFFSLWVGGEGQQEREGENLEHDPQCGACDRAWSHDSEIVTWAKIKSQMLNRLSHPGCSLSLCLSCFPLPTLSRVFWDHVPNILLALNSLCQSLVLEELNQESIKPTWINLKNPHCQMYLDWDWSCIPIRDQIQGNSEEYNFSVLVSVKGMRYFGDQKKKKTMRMWRFPRIIPWVFVTFSPLFIRHIPTI